MLWGEGLPLEVSHLVGERADGTPWSSKANRSLAIAGLTQRNRKGMVD